MSIKLIISDTVDSTFNIQHRILVISIAIPFYSQSSTSKFSLRNLLLRRFPFFGKFDLNLDIYFLKLSKTESNWPWCLKTILGDLRQFLPLLLCSFSVWAMHCVKSICIWSFSSPYHSVLSPNAGKYESKKLRIRTLFTQWCSFQKEL